MHGMELDRLLHTSHSTLTRPRTGGAVRVYDVRRPYHGVGQRQATGGSRTAGTCGVAVPIAPEGGNHRGGLQHVLYQ